MTLTPFITLTPLILGSGGATKVGIGKADCSCLLAMAVLLIFSFRIAGLRR